jgi:thioredoxin-related protein
MKDLSKKLEVVTNVVIIVVSLIVVGFIIQKLYFGGVPKKTPLAPSEGTKLSLSNHDWSENKKTLVLVLSKDCRFCTESAPFYRRLVEKEGTNRGSHIIAVLPQSEEESGRYLNEMGLAGIQIKQASLDSLEVRGTPTLILVNDKGEILDAWIGKLPPEKEAEIISQL